jgi:UDP-GlcNAc:undecaprenyl-phosphate GlcNAc-1-phosphate transferase
MTLPFLMLLFGFGATFYIIPKIIAVVVYKQLMAEPNERSSHTKQTPHLGGVGFYIVLSLGLFMLRDIDSSDLSPYLLAGMLVLFVLGLKDDLVVLGATSKFSGQLVALTFLVLSPSMQQINLHGLFGQLEIPFAMAIVITYLIGIAVINSLNLIDGIDGLAASVGIVFFGAMSWFTYSVDHPFMLAFSMLNIGILLGFLPYNMSPRKKIFMGDTGSMILGLAITFEILYLLNLDYISAPKLDIKPKNTLFVIIGMYFLPLFDTSRVILIRLFKKKHPFKADRNHIHHILVHRLGFSHRRSSWLLFLLALGIFAIIKISAKYLDVFFMFSLISAVYTVCFIIFYNLSKRTFIRQTSRKK